MATVGLTAGIDSKGVKMFKRFKIAEFVTDIDCSSKILDRQIVPYAYDDNEPADIRIKLPDGFIEYQAEKNPHLTLDDLNYIWTGFDFYRQAIHHGAFMIHSSCVVYDNYAYMFSANCGTGKSTHTSFWQKNFGEDKAVILNDDKPLILKKDGIFHAAGTPWSGKSDKNFNAVVPIAGLAILERAEQNSIERITPIDAFKELYAQTYRPTTADEVDKLLTLFNDFLANVGLFRLHCNMSCEAAQTSYEAMRPKK